MQITRRQGLLAGLAGAVAGLAGLGSRAVAKPLPLAPDRSRAWHYIQSHGPLPFFDTEWGRFDTVYSSLDLAPFDVNFDTAKDRLILKDREGRHHHTITGSHAYAGLILLRYAEEAGHGRGINGMIPERLVPRIFLAYVDTEHDRISTERLPWVAASTLLPSPEFKPLLEALGRAREAEYIALGWAKPATS